jgi:hypothetical protein
MNNKMALGLYLAKNLRISRKVIYWDTQNKTMEFIKMNTADKLMVLSGKSNGEERSMVAALSYFREKGFQSQGLKMG